jgi:hypothetical protein
MLDLFFGLDASGFDNSSTFISDIISIIKLIRTYTANFHPVFGPFMMVTYACLSNTLLVTGKSEVLFSNVY